MTAVKVAPTIRLTQTAHIVLGMLSYGHELSGYDIRQWVMRSHGALYKAPAHSQIYGELERLVDAGLVTARAVAQDDNPDKIVHALTDAGRAALHEWVETANVAPPVIKHPLAVQTSFAAGVDATKLIERLQEHIDTTIAMLDDLEDMAVGLTGDADAALAKVVIDWALGIRQADVAGATRAQEELRSAMLRSAEMASTDG